MGMQAIKQLLSRLFARRSPRWAPTDSKLALGPAMRCFDRHVMGDVDAEPYFDPACMGWPWFGSGITDRLHIWAEPHAWYERRIAYERDQQAIADAARDQLLEFLCR